MASRVATKKKGGKRSKRGPKRSRAQVDRNLELTEKLLAEGLPRHAVMVKLQERGVAAASVDRYVARVYERWRTSRSEAAGTLAEQRWTRLTGLARKLEKERKYIPLVQVEKMLNQMAGVNAPQRHVVEPGAGAGAAAVAAIAFDAALHTDEELEFIEAMAEKQLAARLNVVGDTTLAALPAAERNVDE